MSGGHVMDWRVPSTRELDPRVRRGRLLAARRYAPGSIPRHAILGGYWDAGAIVRAHMSEAA
jgi:hypothetical protein